MISWMLVQAHFYIRKRINKKTCPLAKHIPAWSDSNQLLTHGITKLVGICWDDEPTDSNQEFVWPLCMHGPPKKVWWKLNNMCVQINTDLLSTFFANTFTQFFLGGYYPSYPFLANIRKISPVAVAHHNFQSGITWYRYLPFIYPRNCYP